MRTVPRRSGAVCERKTLAALKAGKRAMQLPCSVRGNNARWSQSERQVWCEGPGEDGSLGFI